MKCIEDEIPFELPEGWAWCRFSSGFIINPRNSIQDNIEVSFIPMSLIREGYTNDYKSEIRLWKKVKTGYTHFAENDIAIAKITPCFENKKSVVFRNLSNGYGAGTTELHIIRTLENTVLPEYVLWYIKRDTFISDGINTFSGAVGQKRISKEFIEKYLIPLPPVSEQKRVIEAIHTAFISIDNIEYSNTKLNVLINIAKSKILDLAIRGKLVPQDPNDEPASVLLERIKAEKEELIKQGKIKRDKKESVIFKGEDNSYYQDLPENWELVAFSDIATLISGRDLKSKEYNSDMTGIPYITGASNFNKGKVLINRWTTSPKSISIKNDILLTCKGTVGELAINNHDKIHIARQIMAIRIFANINFQYIKLFFESKILEIKKSADGLIPGISRDDILSLNIPLPPLSEQYRIVQAIETAFSQLDEITNSIS